MMAAIRFVVMPLPAAASAGVVSLRRSIASLASRFSAHQRRKWLPSTIDRWHSANIEQQRAQGNPWLVRHDVIHSSWVVPVVGDNVFYTDLGPYPPKPALEHHTIQGRRSPEVGHYGCRRQ